MARDGDSGATAGLLSAIRREAAARGFDLVGVVDPAAYDASAPAGHRLGELSADARAAVVVGNAGPALWRRFRCAHPGILDRRAGADPLDDFTRAEIAPLLQLLEARKFAVSAFYPFFGATDHALSFRELGIAAGFGVWSVLGLVLHPVYGPWIAVRAALLTGAPLHPTGRLDGFAPCRDCPAPCIAVCPGGAFPDRQWSAAPCLAAKARLDPCRTQCLSRIHCVYGASHRCEPEEMAYHSTW
ncbi:MAG: hypothetical protein ACE5FC_03540, partial [Myxococcota bacterium]